MARPEILLDLYRSGHSPEAIAARFGLTPPRVRKVLRQEIRRRQPPLAPLPKSVASLLEVAAELARGPYDPPELVEALRAADCKWCSGCKAWHHRDVFGLNSNRPDGLATSCRAARAALYDRSGRRTGTPRQIEGIVRWNRQLPRKRRTSSVSSRSSR